jgi:hypothetical protein
MQPAPRRAQECGALAPGKRRQQHERGAGAQHEELADRQGRDQHLAEHVADREHADAEQHQTDAEQRGAALV